MAYSPSPQPGSHTLGGNPTHAIRLSTTPPLSQVISKRDKRRNALLERFNDINSNFARNRDAIYRAQMQLLQYDMNLINSIGLYDNKPLDDFADDIIEALATSTQTSANGARSSQSGARMLDVEALPGAGRWAAQFIQEVNDAFEERDVQLTLVAERHNFKVNDLKQDHAYSILVAQKEHERLLEQIRDRVIHLVTAKKVALTKEKDRLDIGDTNALLHHSSQFSLINPASPGGTLSNRKTRHTRHRLDVDDTGAPGENNKRKRKGPADPENGSPGPSGRVIASESILHLRDAQTKQELQQATASVLSVEGLFSQRELDLHLQAASHAAVDMISSKRRKLSEEIRSSGAPSNVNASDADGDEGEVVKGIPINAPDADTEDPFLGAPEMDRTANSSVHQTRSMRSTGRDVSLASFDIPSDINGRLSAIGLIGTYFRERKNQDDYQRTAPLTESEKDNDLALMAAAIREEEASPGSMNEKVKKDLLPEIIDYVSPAIKDKTITRSGLY